MTIDLFEREDKKLIARCKAIAARIKAQEGDRRERWEPTLTITHVPPETLQFPAPKPILIKRRVVVTGKPDLEIVELKPKPKPIAPTAKTQPKPRQKRKATNPNPKAPPPAPKKDKAPLWATVERWKAEGMRGTLEQLCIESGFGRCYLQYSWNAELKDQLSSAIKNLPWNPEKVGKRTAATNKRMLK